MESKAVTTLSQFNGDLYAVHPESYLFPPRFMRRANSGSAVPLFVVTSEFEADDEAKDLVVSMKFILAT
jgi:hypothetical protein